jgi:hypothetical protein
MMRTIVDLVPAEQVLGHLLARPEPGKDDLDLAGRL